MASDGWVPPTVHPCPSRWGGRGCFNHARNKCRQEDGASNIIEFAHLGAALVQRSGSELWDLGNVSTCRWWLKASKFCLLSRVVMCWSWETNPDALVVLDVAAGAHCARTSTVGRAERRGGPVCGAPWPRSRSRSSMLLRCERPSKVQRRPGEADGRSAQGFKEGPRGAVQQAEKSKNERHHTYATFLYRFVWAHLHRGETSKAGGAASSISSASMTTADIVPA